MSLYWATQSNDFESLFLFVAEHMCNAICINKSVGNFNDIGTDTKQ